MVKINVLEPNTFQLREKKSVSESESSFTDKDIFIANTFCYLFALSLLSYYFHGCNILFY